jgi:hypothetical protein
MTRTFQLVPHDKIPEFKEKGWTITDDLADCHHGNHSVLMAAPKPKRAVKAAAE